MKYANSGHEEVYAILFRIVVTFSQSHAKNIHTVRALDKVIIYIAMLINENYNCNKYCCINNKQVIQLSTPNL